MFPPIGPPFLLPRLVYAQAPSLHGRYSLLRYYEPVRLPTRARHVVMHSHITLVLVLSPSTALSGLPGPPRLFFPRALSPLTPVSPASALVRCFVAGGRLLHFRQSGRSLLCVNEAESGSLALPLACLRARGPASRIAPTHARTPYLLHGQLTR